MLFLVVGIALLAMKVMEFGVVAQWSWYVVLAPFALAVAWWAWADWSGYTKKRQMAKEDDRRQARIDKQRANLGMKPGKKR
jgi:small Trp-rich protein